MSRTADAGGTSEEVLGQEVLAQGRYVAFKKLRWRDSRGQPGVWESAERVGDRGAVLIIPRLRRSGKLVVIRQFRPPARGVVYEFPAGLVDEGETPASAAARELREETGYRQATFTIWPSAYTTPGLSNETVYMVEADIDEEAEENLNPRPEFDGSENIETLLVSADELRKWYVAAVERKESFDAKLAAYILARP